MGRWDRFHEARAVTADAWLAGEVVKELSRDLQGWPPPVLAWTDDRARARFEPALAPDARPSVAVFRAAFQLARFELERRFDAIEDFHRNDRGAAATGGVARDALALELLSRWLVDVLLEVLEATGRKRAFALDCLARVEARVLG